MSLRIGCVSLMLATLSLAACASTTWNGYPGGSVKSSQLNYSYRAKPVLDNSKGKTYRVEADSTLSGVTSIRTLDERGLSKTASGGDVVFTLKAGAIRSEPEGIGFKAPYLPGMSVKMPIEIQVKDRRKEDRGATFFTGFA